MVTTHPEYTLRTTLIFAFSPRLTSSSRRSTAFGFQQYLPAFSFWHEEAQFCADLSIHQFLLRSHQFKLFQPSGNLLDHFPIFFNGFLQIRQFLPHLRTDSDMHLCLYFRGISDYIHIHSTDCVGISANDTSLFPVT